ncbi:hypothetical protein SCHPADRAFT_895329 [Schizopora paradoxa]|uniref:BTB domain-containing protein n=1 Tax=Schizopora paradoxa TaxID=27342 RepID=A0A0H2R418_9AGAM|nr:hypothetical protein SCHPADRAFT_895329 [Schizopora paradoxa]
MNVLPQKHDHLWFGDGNVVLATNALLFRVHKGVLSLHSTVLSDMFALIQEPVVEQHLSQGDSSSMDIFDSVDSYEGLPLVMMAGDKGDDVAHLLRAIYERGYYDREDDTTPLDMITALLSLSAKYDVATVRRDVVRHLSRHFPSDLAAFESTTFVNSPLFGKPRIECYFPLLCACVTSQVDLQAFLPALLYACSAIPINKIIEEQLPILPMPMAQALLLGERYLDYHIRSNLSTTLDMTSPRSGCPFAASISVCDTTRRMPQTHAMTRLFCSTELADIKGEHVVDVFFEKRCERCRHNIAAVLETRRNRIWEKMPTLFGLDGWGGMNEMK